MRLAIHLSRGAFALMLALCCQAMPALATPSDACRSLARLYARAPEQIDAQSFAALQDCLAADPSQAAPAPQQQHRWGEWPTSPDWVDRHKPSTTSWERDWVDRHKPSTTSVSW